MKKKQKGPSRREQYKALRNKFRRSLSEWEKLIGQDILLAKNDGEVPKVATVLDVSDNGRVKLRYYRQEVWEELDFNDVLSVGLFSDQEYSMVEGAKAPTDENAVWPTKEYKELKNLKQAVGMGVE